MRNPVRMFAAMLSASTIAAATLLTGATVENEPSSPVLQRTTANWTEEESVGTTQMEAYRFLQYRSLYGDTETTPNTYGPSFYWGTGSSHYEDNLYLNGTSHRVYNSPESTAPIVIDDWDISWEDNVDYGMSYYVVLMDKQPYEGSVYSCQTEKEHLAQVAAAGTSSQIVAAASNQGQDIDVRRTVTIEPGGEFFLCRAGVAKTQGTKAPTQNATVQFRGLFSEQTAGYLSATERYLSRQ